MTETWKDIPGYEGRYQVSDLGNVRSLDRYVKGGPGRVRIAKGRMLSMITMPKNRYFSVTLWKDNTYLWISVHKLVALAFLGGCPEGKETLHSDGNPENNRVGNLRYGTRKENVADAIKHGTHIKGATQGSAKLCDEDVIFIKNSPLNQRILGELFGVHQSNISRIKNTKAWKHV